MIRNLAMAAIGIVDDELEDEPGPRPTDDARDCGETPAAHKFRGRRVLVVEDDYLVGLTICDLLTGAGYTVLGPAVTGEDAVSMALEERPNIVLMDIRLAGEMDGVEAAIEIARAGIRSLFVSAHSDPQTRSRGQAASPHGWVEKPFSDAQLLDAVAAALR